MSIYVSLVTLEDPEIIHTINSALSHADNKDDIHIGIAACVSEEFYRKYILALTYQKQVTAKRFDINKYKGLGKARKLSRFAYNNEDYILQVDPHTHFEKGWDTFLVNEFTAALEELGNEKMVITSYIPGYYHDDTGIRFTTPDNKSRYNIFFHADNRPYSSIKLWGDFTIDEFPEEMLDDRVNDRFLPANKITACFMFGNKNFVDFSGLPENVIFWDEEIIQGIELLAEGFYLVFLNSYIPIYHRYTNSPGTKRQATPDVYNVGEMFLQSMITANIYDYIENNKEKVERYKEYAKYDLFTGNVRPFHIPKSYDFYGN